MHNGSKKYENYEKRNKRWPLSPFNVKLFVHFGHSQIYTCHSNLDGDMGQK